MFVGDNRAYFSTTFADSVKVIPGAPFDPAHPINRSPNNTGLTALPPALGAYVWYPYAASPEFPIVGSGGRTAMAGPVFYRDDFRGATRPFPQYYDGKLIVYDWLRGWIMTVTMDARGDLVSMERFMASTKFNNPMDMQFGRNGALTCWSTAPAGFRETRTRASSASSTTRETGSRSSWPRSTGPPAPFRCA